MPTIRTATLCGAAVTLLLGVALAQETRRVPAVPPTDDASAPDASSPRIEVTPDNDATTQDERDAGFYRASELIGTTVKGQGGESLGQIEDLLVDRRSQQIRYFILSEGGKVNAKPGRTVAPDVQANQTSNLTVIPWSVARPQFGQTVDSRVVTVPLAPQRLQQAPTFTWQELQRAPTRWVPDVDRFYGVSGPGVRGQIAPQGRVKVERDGDIEIKRDRD